MSNKKFNFLNLKHWTDPGIDNLLGTEMELPIIQTQYGNRSNRIIEKHLQSKVIRNNHYQNLCILLER